jgi:hypothetical protein
MRLGETIMTGTNRRDGVFFIFILAGALYLLVEAVLQWTGRSLCATEGCRMTLQLTRFGDPFMVLGAFLALGALGLLSGLNLKRPSSVRDTLINLGLIAALAAEGFFVGYQLFWLPEVCLFCLSVFAVVLLLALLRWFSGWKEIGYGFAAFALILILPALVLPPPGKAFPLDRTMVLFYSDDCKHCTEIKAEIKKRNLDIPFIQVKEYGRELKGLGVEGIPTLWVNGPNEKLLLTGKETIRRFLDTDLHPEKVPPSALRPWISEEGKTKKGGTTQLRPPASTALPPSVPYPNPLFHPSPEDQACRQEQKCD